MINIILTGAMGKMGSSVTAAAADREGFRIIAGVDLREGNRDYPVFSSFSEIPADITDGADVIIDFSNPSAFGDMLDYAVSNKIGAVVCTTGLSEEQVTKLKSAAYSIPIFFSANMSLGVNLLCELSRKAAAALGSDFDIEIIEMHHNQKVDAPSGTAYMIADTISAELGTEPSYEYDRHSKREKRPNNEIGIHSVRGGNITGEHQVIFAGNDEVITLSHSARSKGLFASGALNAAVYTAGKENGFFSMKDLIG